MFNSRVENFNKRGSNWQLEKILKFVVTTVPYHPLAGSSYIPTPKYLANKYCILNIKNDDQMCFAYSILASLFPCENGHRGEVTPYRRYMQHLNLEGHQFPLPLDQVPKFEDTNPQLSVTVLYYDSKNGICPLYVTSHRNRQHVTLLLLTDDHGNFHYTLVRSLSRLVGDRTRHGQPTHVCEHCLHPFNTKV